jgi:hypothetical protein
MFLANQGHFAISLEGKNTNEDAFQLCLRKTQHLFQLSFSEVVNWIVIFWLQEILFEVHSILLNHYCSRK